MYCKTRIDVKRKGRKRKGPNAEEGEGERRRIRKYIKRKR